MTRALTSGAAGALALTTLHQFAQRRVAYAPRMDLVAIRGLRRMFGDDHDARRLHRLALIGDLVSNSLYYAAIPAPTARATGLRAGVLGLSAGLGALLLPQRIGLGAPPHSHQRANQVMTVGWYVAGALVAAFVGTMTGARETHRD